MTKKMPVAPKPAPGDKKFGRSAVTNGKLIDGDMRSKTARRLRDLTERFTAEIGGGELTATEEMVVANCALAKMKSEEQAAKLATGEDVSDEDAVRVGNMCSRATRDLYAAKAKRAVVATAGMSPLDRVVADIVARRAEPVAEPVDEDDDDAEPFDLAAHEEPAREPAVAYQPPVEAIEPVAVEPEPVVEPVKPPQDVAVWYDGHPKGPSDPHGRPLPQIVGEIQAHGIERISFTTPAANHKSIEVGAVLAIAGTVLSAKACWFVKGLDL